MINKQLFKYTNYQNLIFHVTLKILSLIISISIWLLLSFSLATLIKNNYLPFLATITIIPLLFIKVLLTRYIARYTYESAADLRANLRIKILNHALKLNNNQKQISASRLTQLASDGVEQLEIYYANFLPHLFYSCIAVFFIFITLSFFSFIPAFCMLICVPLIPIIIMLVMKIAKRILGKYWTDYMNLGEIFYENLQGLTTLMAYGQDEFYQQKMQKSAEKFRKSTMSLLAMQLNSIGVMDIISYAGAGLGLALALFEFEADTISLQGMIMFILLSAEFFLPMRLLGSLFHVAMNGISSCKLIFDYLDIETNIQVSNQNLLLPLTSISISNLSFSYENKNILNSITLNLQKGELTALVGVSGSGKSTIAKLLTKNLSCQNQIYYNDQKIESLKIEDIRKETLYVHNQDYIYQESIRYNLCFDSDIPDNQIWQILEKVDLAKKIINLPQKLDTVLQENGSDLSGGERQRLILARSLLRNASFYIFDEITSGVDKISEQIIQKTINELANEKIVLLITHRLYQLIDLKNIYLLDNGTIVDYGTYNQLKQNSLLFQEYLNSEENLIKGANSFAKH